MLAGFSEADIYLKIYISITNQHTFMILFHVWCIEKRPECLSTASFCVTHLTLCNLAQKSSSTHSVFLIHKPHSVFILGPCALYWQGKETELSVIHLAL
jgi:hypothetical protein